MLSLRVAVAQSYVTVSGQNTSYQKLSEGELPGAVKICEIEELPLVGEVPPTLAAYVPVCAPELTAAVVPAVVQPDNVPVSKPPLVTSAIAGWANATPARMTAVAPAMASRPRLDTGLIMGCLSSGTRTCATCVRSRGAACRSGADGIRQWRLGGGAAPPAGLSPPQGT
ncbi:hypothetical protein ACFYZ9_18620 [Streptomyces sp. NPDC001691]|uniref:hypothetical protein n=1 Tax=Streptomyces sp. NPDC001691 TaxID=3364600 RepID=UPI0036AAA327